MEQAMLASIDIDAIEQELGIFHRSAPKPKPVEQPRVVHTTKATSTRCRRTNKVQFKTALVALAALRSWKMRDPDMCWDLKRLRVYQCRECHQFHLGKK